MLGDSVAKLVTNDIDTARKVVEEIIAIAKDHLQPLGKPDWISTIRVFLRGSCVKAGLLTSVCILLAKMDRADHIHVPVIYRVPLEVLFIKIENDTDVLEGLIDALILDGGFTLGAN
jgi:hypothetical protein